MPRVRVHCFSLSADGFGAGPDQSLEAPLGVGGMALHEWVFGTRTFKAMHGQAGDGGHDAELGIHDGFAARGFEGIGAWILGRNMFGPVRGPWRDDGWRGWWGDEPPYHCPVFVLTHHAREPLEMRGGTTFHFVTGGIHAALAAARAAAGDRDVRIGGGVDTLRRYLRERLVDELHLAIAPVLLGRGEHLFRDLDLPALGYRTKTCVPAPLATHLVLTNEVAA